MNKPFSIAALQMVSRDDIEQNLQHVATQVEAAAKAQANAVLLPENFSAMGVRPSSFAEEFGNGPIQSFLSELASKWNIHIFAGSLPLKAEEADQQRVYTALLHFNRQGECVARYNKIHLFDVNVGDAQGQYKESRDFLHGSDVVVSECDGICIGLSICYDLRFPELYRALVDQGAQLLLMPAAFTETTGRAHWQALLQARAIENS